MAYPGYGGVSLFISCRCDFTAINELHCLAEKLAWGWNGEFPIKGVDCYVFYRNKEDDTLSAQYGFVSVCKLVL